MSDSIAHYWKLFRTQCTFFNSLNEYLPLTVFCLERTEWVSDHTAAPHSPPTPPPQIKKKKEEEEEGLALFCLC